jgi:4-amino-4-deoxychorismate lyase
MSRFLETIRIRDGAPLHLEWHQRRVDDTFRVFYPGVPPLSLDALIAETEMDASVEQRCRIVYDEATNEITVTPFQPRTIRSLRLTDLPPDYDYRYKYADRRILELAFSRRGDADDVLLLRDGWITDTSVANVAFLSNGRWYTPALPLLAGTTWKRLVSGGVIVPRPVHADDLHRFEACIVLNALNEWDERSAIPVSAISR